MILRLSFSIIAILFSFIGTSQNLVPNWSFEEYDECPTHFDQIFYASNWQSFRLTPDLLASCADPSSDIAIPSNSYFVNNCSPVDGENCGGFVQLHYPSLRSEVLGVELIEALEIGVDYYISFYVRRGQNSNNNCWSNNIGAKFTTTAYSDWPLEVAMPISNEADVLFNESVSTPDAWVKVEGWFQADSSYTHLAIGNMFDSELLDIECDEEYFNYSVYYFVDCVCVSSSSDYCNGLASTIQAKAAGNAVGVYPNPSAENLHFQLNELQIIELQLYSSIGQMTSSEFQAFDSQLNIEHLSPGLYLLKLKLSDLSIQTIPFIKE